MPITESTPQLPVSPYGYSKLMAERAIFDFIAANAEYSAVILRYFNVIGSDPYLRLGEAPQPELARRFGRISFACFEAARGLREGLSIMGTDLPTPDGTCVRDYIHVSDLVRAHVMGLTLHDEK